MTRYLMRPSRLTDFGALMELAENSGTGFTSLPVNEELLRSKLEKSIEAFSGKTSEPDYGKYLMMMEDTRTGEVVGCSAVKCGVGVEAPFFNYRIITVAQASHAAGKRFDMDALILTNEFVGYTEVGTLFLKAEHRGGGAGRLAAQSRYLLMATAPERFGERVLAELRGVTDQNGNTPFWNCLGAHFFRMSFPEADYLSAVSDNQFILDLMPKYPIYIDLIPEEGRQAIGRCHSEGVGAKKLLEWEGFRFERTVDIFDGGPLVAADTGNIRTINESSLVQVEAGSPDGSVTGLIASTHTKDFTCMQLLGQMQNGNKLVIDADQLEIMGLKGGDMARIWIRTP
ncbi:MAG: arginine N-succinyltransferase [Hyphomonadaceae bacterium]